MATLVDSNVLLDIFKADPVWCDWSQTSLADALTVGHVGINQLVYAEISVAFATLAELDAVLAKLQIMRFDLPWDVAQFAATAFVAYRRSGAKNCTTARFLYICSCSSTWTNFTHPRCQTLPHIFSEYSSGVPYLNNWNNRGQIIGIIGVRSQLFWQNNRGQIPIVLAERAFHAARPFRHARARGHPWVPAFARMTTRRHPHESGGGIHGSPRSRG